VLTAALDFSKYAIVVFQDRLLTKLHSSENIIFKEMNKVGLCVMFLGAAILMGTCFFAVNENWSAAKAFYWTMMTMTVSLLFIEFIILIK
jgi:predicted phage tail protein